MPAGWAGRRVDLLWDSASEATLWLDGLPAQGLNRHHHDAVLVERAAGGERLAFEVELACNDLFGDAAVALRAAPVRPRPLRPRGVAALARLRDPAGALRGAGARRGVGRRAPLRAQPLLQRLAGAAGRTRSSRSSTSVATRRRRTRSSPSATRTSTPPGSGRSPRRYRKAVRTFTTQARYLREYPDYRFACSQAQQYAWIEETRPGALARASTRSSTPAAGCPSAAPGSSPTATCPRASRSLRQFLHGQRFFERALRPPLRASSGTPTCSATTASCRRSCARAGIGRLPDPEALLEPVQPARAPHLRLAGDRRQRGARALPAGRHLQRRGTRRRAAPDGARATRITTALARQRCSSTATATAAAGRRARCSRPCSAPRDLAGVCRARDWARPHELFERARGRARRAGRRSLGELYFEYHRGTYTSQARDQARQPAREIALHDAEVACALAAGWRPPYPRAELDRAVEASARAASSTTSCPARRSPRSTSDAERDLADVEAARERDRRAALRLAALGGAAGQHDALRAPRGRRAPDGRARDGRGSAVRSRGRRSPNRLSLKQHKVTRDGLVLENEHLPRRARRRTAACSASSSARRGREALRRAGQPARALRGPAGRLRRVGHRPVPPRDARRTVRRRRPMPIVTDVAAARRGRLRAHASARRARMRQVVRLDAGSRRLEFHTDGRLARGAPPAQGLSSRSPCARRRRDLRDAVRRRGAPDALLHEPRPGALRGARPPLRRPLRARLRRRRCSPTASTATALRRRRCASACCARPKTPDPEADMGRHEFAYAISPTPAVGGGGVRGRGGAVQPAAAPVPR